MSGIIVVLEGLDGNGKSTQSEMLVSYLAKQGLHTSRYSYPDHASHYGNHITAYLHKEAEMGVEELFFNYLTDMVKDRKRIEKDLDNNKVVIMDRYFFSTVAFQSAGGLDYDRAKEIENVVALPKPDLVIYFKIAPRISMARKQKQLKKIGDKPDIHEENLELQRRTEFFYNKMMAENFGAGKWILVGAEKESQLVHREVVAAVDALLTKIHTKT